MGDHGIELKIWQIFIIYRVDFFFDVIDKQLKKYIFDMHLHNDFLCSKEIVIMHKSWWRQREID